MNNLITKSGLLCKLIIAKIWVVVGLACSIGPLLRQWRVQAIATFAETNVMLEGGNKSVVTYCADLY